MLRHKEERVVHTPSKLLRLLRYHPVITVNVTQLEPREESPNQRQHFIWDVVAFDTTNKESSAIVSCLVRVFEREISHVTQRRREYLDGYAEMHVFVARRADEVCQEELANRY